MKQNTQNTQTPLDLHLIHVNLIVMYVGSNSLSLLHYYIHLIHHKSQKTNVIKLNLNFIHTLAY